MLLLCLSLYILHVLIFCYICFFPFLQQIAVYTFLLGTISSIICMLQLTLVALRGGRSAPLRFFHSNFFFGNFSFTKPTLTIIILVYYKLCKILKKLVVTLFQNFIMGGQICPPSGLDVIPAAQGN